MRALLSDLRFALRLLARDRAFAVTTILTLTLCVGANAAVFTVVRSVLLRPLPYAEPDRLVFSYDSFPGAGVERAGTSVPNHMDRLAFSDVFESLALYRARGVEVGRAGSAERVRAMAVTPSLFRVLRVSPLRGRPFSEAEGTPGQNHAAVLDFGYAQAAFGSAEAAMGREMTIDGERYAVIGVMPRSFTFLDPDVRIWVPLAFSNEQRSENRRYSQNHDEVARLAPGVTLKQAQQRVDALNVRSIERAGAFKPMLERAGYQTHLVPLAEDVVRTVRRPLQLLWAGVLFVLLIAAVNITNLVLVRASGRMKELAMRHALGAGRSRVARQLLTETTLITAIGACLGIAVAAASLGWLTSLGRADLPRGEEIRMDWAVVAFTAGLAMLLGLSTGAVPIAQLAGMNVSLVLREDGRSGTASRGARAFRRSLVVAQVALAFVLLIGAGLLFASFRQLLGVDPGFQPAQVLTARLNLPQTRYPDDAALRTFAGRTLEAIRQLPGVRAAGFTSGLPFVGDNSSSVIIAEGYVMAPGESLISPSQICVTPGYFEAMRIPLERGRFFGEQDSFGAPAAIIVDERLARKFWPNADPIGRRMYQPQGPEDIIQPGPKTHFMRVVGVVGTVRQQALADTGDERVGAYYLPFAQGPESGIAMAVRTGGDPVKLAAAIRTVLAKIDPSLPLYDVRAMPERVERSLDRRRTPMLLSVAFGFVALLLASIGIYGVLAYQVGLRSREIGIRMALGSDPSRILRLILREGIALVAVGLLLGAAGVVAIRPAIASQLFGVTVLDPVVVLSVTLVLGGAAAVACLAPAWKASRVDPVSALSRQ
ncbi:MAG TPA: ABC transporter permease [Vicinamibacterales bacterium]|jgi:predicted permease